MKVIRKEQADVFKNSDTSSLLEYSIALNEKAMDFCINTITGRYPEKGYCTNEECKELCYILEGEGSVVTREETINFTQGDVVFIDKKEVYHWSGNCKIIMVCSPAWYKEQCKLFDK